MPGEAEKAAKLMKMSLKDFFKTYLAVDVFYNTQEGDDKDIFLLAPAVVGQEPGDIYPFDPTGVCIFLQSGLCQIHKAKPFECQMYWHGDKAGSERHQEVAMAWKKHQEQIKKLLGRKPVRVEPSLVDMFGFMTGMMR